MSKRKFDEAADDLKLLNKVLRRYSIAHELNSIACGLRRIADDIEESNRIARLALNAGETSAALLRTLLTNELRNVANASMAGKTC